MRSNTKTKQITVLAMLSALAYIVMVFGRIPVVLFLKYDPKDVVIAIGGLIYGPLSAFAVSAVVSLVEMFTVSDTGWIGLAMNIISSCSFACLAAFIYKKNRSLMGAVIGLAAGVALMIAVMLSWNYLLVPIYNPKMEREAVAGMLVPVFLPFNLLKGGLNAAITMLLYKPVTIALRKQKLLPTPAENNAVKGKMNIGVILLSVFVIATCALFILVLQGKL